MICLQATSQLCMYMRIQYVCGYTVRYTDIGPLTGESVHLAYVANR